MTNSQIGRWSSVAVFLVGLAYIVALLIGFTTRGLSAPIVDPLLAVMEILTLIAAPLMLVMTAAIYGRASDERKAVGNMRLQLVGVFAYGGVLPVVALLLSGIFRGGAATVTELPAVRST